MSAISHDSSLLNVEKLFLGSSIAKISKASLLDAQKQDPVVGRLLNFMKEGTWPMSWEVTGRKGVTEATAQALP